MDYGLYLSAMGLKAQQTRQNVIANNLANLQTNGFKRDLLAMQSRANATSEDPQMFQYRVPVTQDQGGGVLAAGAGMDLSQGMLKGTDNATDVALNGPGFFTLRGDKGEKLLTRDGQFILDKQGALVTANGGRAVLDSNGQPISLNPNLPVRIAPNGDITQGDADGGGSTRTSRMGVVDVSNSRQLIKLGGNVMRVNDPSALTDASAQTQVRQFNVESSGVDPVLEMVNMIECQRAFEANAKMITYDDQTLSQVNTIARVA